MALEQSMAADGDAQFLGVDTLTPAHQLAPGLMADARNKRIEDGRAVPRHNVNRQAWGRTTDRDLVDGASYAFYVRDTVVTVTGFVVGHKYTYERGDSDSLSSAVVETDAHHPADETEVQPGVFTAGSSTYYLILGPDIARTTAKIWSARPCAFSRFNDPNGDDNLVLLTDDWRDGGGEDGGRGRAWQLRSGQGPVAISLNGHDVWGTSRLIPCFNGLVLLRQGNERHYFSAAGVLSSKIQLNATPAWASGDRVLYVAEAGSYITGSSPPQTNTEYFVKNVGSNQIELYTTAALATKLVFNVAVGKFYIERRADAPGYYGNGAPPLILQPAVGSTAFQVGFKAVPAQAFGTAWDASNKILTAPNHRLIPGDAVSYFRSADSSTTAYYANPTSDNTAQFFTTQAKAIGGLAADAQDIIGGSSFTAGADYVMRTGANGAPTPAGREGAYSRVGRLIVVNGRNHLAISDPLDPLHFTPFRADVTANLGESDPVTGVIELGQDAILIAKEGKLELLQNFSQGASGWLLTGVTAEYGVMAPRSLVAVGPEAWGLGRKGVVSVRQTELGLLQGVALPVSRPMQKYLDMIDWGNAGQSCAAVWNNRYYLAIPLKGQTGTIRNNGMLVYNFLTQQWEGLWTGTNLEVYDLARHQVFGQERLCYVNYEGLVSWLGDGWTDLGEPIADLVLTRVYSRGNMGQKLFLRGRAVWETQGPSLTVTAVAPGYNEEQVLLSGKQYDATKYLVNGEPDYDPGTATEADFDKPGREDYSLSAAELTVGVLDAHQNISEGLRMRVEDWGVQLRIENSRGSCRLLGTEVEFVPRTLAGSRRT